MDLDAARRIALSLPEATEAPHFEATSFRIRGKIFATAPPHGEHINVFVDESETAASVAENPAAFEEVWWGKKLAGVRAELAESDPDRLRELLVEAWRRKAPKRLAATLDDSSC